MGLMRWLKYQFDEEYRKECDRKERLIKFMAANRSVGKVARKEST